ncbi:hypothetical protein JNUCC0626_50120 (plasmid) [Lentzea sp. JNUCC 0626]|uniref:hypothetical protein n=1 Tax=Lentzea sp. JNUCC 0626 TaxID=3367513 RepID=UPI003749CE6B
MPTHWWQDVIGHLGDVAEDGADWLVDRLESRGFPQVDAFIEWCEAVGRRQRARRVYRDLLSARSAVERELGRVPREDRHRLYAVGAAASEGLALVYERVFPVQGHGADGFSHVEQFGNDAMLLRALAEATRPRERGESRAAAAPTVEQVAAAALDELAANGFRPDSAWVDRFRVLLRPVVGGSVRFAAHLR